MSAIKQLHGQSDVQRTGSLSDYQNMTPEQHLANGEHPYEMPDGSVMWSRKNPNLVNPDFRDTRVDRPRAVAPSAPLPTSPRPDSAAALPAAVPQQAPQPQNAGPRGNVVSRGTIVPDVTYEDGSHGIGFPSIIAEPFEAMGRLTDNVLSGRNATSPTLAQDNAVDAFSAATLIPSLRGIASAPEQIAGGVAKRNALARDAAAKSEYEAQLAKQAAADEAMRSDPLYSIKQGIEQRRALAAQRLAEQERQTNLRGSLRQTERTNDMVGRSPPPMPTLPSQQPILNDALRAAEGGSPVARSAESIRPRPESYPAVDEIGPYPPLSPPRNALARMDQPQSGLPESPLQRSTILGPETSLQSPSMRPSLPSIVDQSSRIGSSAAASPAQAQVAANSLPSQLAQAGSPSSPLSGADTTSNALARRGPRLSEADKLERKSYTKEHREIARDEIGKLSEETPDQIQQKGDINPFALARQLMVRFQQEGLPTVELDEIVRRALGTDKQFKKLRDVHADFKKTDVLDKLVGGVNKLAIGGAAYGLTQQPDQQNYLARPN
jgi:hypothetical protein